MIIGMKGLPVRFNYLRVFEAAASPSGDMKFSVCVLIPKAPEYAPLLAQINASIDKAIAKGIEAGKFTKAQVEAASFKRGLRDGDLSEELGPEFMGNWFLNASSAEKDQPGIVNAQAKPIMNRDDIYSGAWGYVDANSYAFNNAGNKGVAWWLNNVMMVKDGDRLDGKMKAEDAFAGFTVESDTTTDLT